MAGECRPATGNLEHGIQGWSHPDQGDHLRPGSYPIGGRKVLQRLRRPGAADRLPEKVAAAIVEFITGPFADNPQRVSKDLTGRLAGYRSSRRGDYRVVIKIIEVDRVVLVDRIDHRSHIYRPR